MAPWTCRVALAGLLGMLVVGCSGEPDRRTGPGEAPPGSPSTDPRDSGPTPLAQVVEGTVLTPGSYHLSARGRSDVPPVVIDVPAGFEAGGDFLVASGEAFGAMGYWRVTGIYTDPCTKRGTGYDVGATVDDLAEVLASQDLLSPTKPRPDVANKRLVLNTYVEPKATQRQDQALTDVVSSARFTKRDASAM